MLWRKPPHSLKNNLYGAKKATVIFTDDVSKKVREEGRMLKTQHLPDLLNKPSVKVAFIPYTMPARIQYKEEDSWKFFSYPRSN